MTREELLNKIKQLPIAEREAMVQEVSRSIQEELQPNGSFATGEEQRHRIEKKLAAVSRLRGAFKSKASLPTDGELKDDYINCLMKKYS